MNILTVGIIYFIRCLRRDNKMEQVIIKKEKDSIDNIDNLL